MEHKQFSDIVNQQIENCKDLLTRKGQEYSLDTDRLMTFKQAGKLQKTTARQALLGMLTKHIISVYDMCRAKTVSEFTEWQWDEKINDSINYLLILRAVIQEDHENEKHTN